MTMANVDENDLALINKLISEVERSQNERSAEDFLALFRPDAVWVTAFGRRFTSKAEIADFTRKVLTPDLGDQYARYDVAHVTMLSPEVAAVNVRQRPIHKDGSPIAGELEGSPLYVLVKENGRWMIGAGQNTKVQTVAIDTQQGEIDARDGKK
ncbi:uncharacterized protein (TIGR02246 family) [Aminobacter lissarensis]|uniref:Uncharacterized protein (TIGR02246 family) n=2 Tax=Aminobacter carboxidus TaxID=376165 RepID=A0A8E1WCE9_9HYPH|nr:uncharacterized protein (TIGR02246 family) [Aminobacter lissarensis]